ncbi:MAG TPA: ABC transporter ATP-binding protein [Chloroflexi bacterium]|nr:ABC transporter ATP-binding protein [Chloroflexota bacterium]
MIHLEGLSKRFDGFTAVDGVTLSVAPGEILALLGPNGAGKTTTVRMLAAILRPTEGSAVVAGFDTIQDPIAVRRRVGMLTEHPGLYLRMRGGEYLDFFGRVYGLDVRTREQRARRLLEQFSMPEAWDRRIGEFSKGMRQKMALARALLHEPPVLLLDEPTSAMDPHSAKIVRDTILSLRDERRAILVCTHNLAEAEIVADRIAIISRGQIVALGTPAALKHRLLGPPMMELRLAGASDGVVAIVSRFARPVEWGPGWLRYQTDSPETVNPSLLKSLAESGVQVITLSEVARSLEAVYLRAVEEV